MNISQMMRGLLGDAVSGETRAMELKVGQVVRGVVVQTFENNEALIQINGVQVRAKLEMPMTAGQSAMLQVQPDSNGSLVMLKAVDLSASGLLDDTFRDYAKLLGLPDQRWALDIIKDLRREGFPFNRTTALAFQAALAAMPRGMDTEQWMTAAAAAFKRGLPMTATTIASMGQVMFGRAPHELMDSLQRQLGAFVADSGMPEAGGDARAAQHAGARVLALLMQGDALLRGGLAASGNGSSAGAAAAQGQGQPAAAPAQPAVPGQAAQALTPNASQSAAQSAAQVTGQSAAQAAAGGMSGALAGQAAATQSTAPAAGTNWLGGMMKWLGVDHELQLAKAATTVDASGQQGSAQASKQAASDTGVLRPQAGAAGGQPQSAAPGQAASVAGGVDGEAPATLPARTEQPMAGLRSDTAALSARSAEAGATEAGRGQAASVQPVSQQPQQGLQSVQATMTDAASRGDQTPASSQPVQHAAAAPSSAVPTETLKNALLTLMQASDMPPAIKETAQQLIHQITGQQLLLTPERNSSVFTHVTMFIPLKDAEGGTTASVHIQTRRGKRGELDADNCRLLFNLSMASLGDTLVDVNVTDKIVSLNIWNDHPAIADLIEGSRNDIAERLQGTGYQLLSLRTTPLPNREAGEEQAIAAKDKKQQAPPDLAQFASTRYKGVDYRI
ncbi:flagellar hook-length control protein FliK [Paenibacillus sp. 1011MAR3C5]|uniref:flagellar hook-length control protein FliK n=1 Tax=Paenibacillus sp. 1011MAR3C5 TaxID=1675787 RepID=UPI000E6BCD41|nr:flagellar hook-length control protein FliK [Paenibacillus sp. 1011MAR3C5]RJE86732.1 flagellar hook-length control protein FliK [Paenibacillus sp. 1011MAR3C5]